MSCLATSFSPIRLMAAPNQHRQADSQGNIFMGFDLDQNYDIEQNTYGLHNQTNYGDDGATYASWSLFPPKPYAQMLQPSFPTAPPHRNPPSEIHQLREFHTAPRLNHAGPSTSATLYSMGHNLAGDMNIEHAMVRSPSSCINQCSL